MSKTHIHSMDVRRSHAQTQSKGQSKGSNFSKRKTIAGHSSAVSANAIDVHRAGAIIMHR